MNNESNRISTLVKGILMGWAEVVPGVSGGTIAFITGIYERLLASVSSFGPGLIRVFKEKGLKAVWEKIDGNFVKFDELLVKEENVLKELNSKQLDIETKLGEMAEKMTVSY